MKNDLISRVRMRTMLLNYKSDHANSPTRQSVCNDLLRMLEDEVKLPGIAPEREENESFRRYFEGGDGG